jgi:hypothetical protein
MPDRASVEPAAETETDAAFDHAVDPPDTFGMEGDVRSSMAVAVAPTVVQPDMLPALSTARKRTVVVPSAETGTDAPPFTADQAPPLRDVSYWKPETPDRGSVELPPLTVTDAAFDQEDEPPDTLGTDGAVRSRSTVLPGVTADQAERLPAVSRLRNSTCVVPSPVTVTDEPAVAEVQLLPSGEVRYWYPENPEPPVSDDPDALTFVEAALSHVDEPPLTLGTLGAV